MVSKVCIPTLRISKAINDACCDDSIFYSLVDLRFQIFCHVEIISDGSRSIDQFLRRSRV